MTKALAAGAGSSVTIFTSFSDMPFFFRIQASVKYGLVPGAEAATVLPLRSATLAMLLRATMPSEPMPWSILNSWVVAMPLVFHTIQVSTVVAAHCRSPEAMARWRSFCGIFLMVHVEAVGLVDAGLLGERQRREAGPAGNADGDLGLGCACAERARRRRQGRHSAAKVVVSFSMLDDSLGIDDRKKRIIERRRHRPG